MKKRYIYILLVLLLTIGGCGYGLGLGAFYLPYIKTIYVETFDNKTYEANIEITISDDIRILFNENGTLKVVNSREEADCLLQGEIIEYRRQPSRYSEEDEKIVDEYKLVLITNLKFTDLVKKRVLWTEQNFFGYAYYVVSGPRVATQTHVYANSETEAFPLAAADLARNIIDRTIENW